VYSPQRRIQLFSTNQELTEERSFDGSSWSRKGSFSAPTNFFSKEITMSKLFRGTSRVVLAILGLLLVGGAVAFAQHNAK
jgi:hypothetical protein